MSLSELRETYRILCDIAQNGEEYVAGARTAHHAAIVRHNAWTLYGVDFATTQEGN